MSESELNNRLREFDFKLRRKGAIGVLCDEHEGKRLDDDVEDIISRVNATMIRTSCR